MWDVANADLAKRAVLDCYGIDIDDGIAPSLVTVEVDAGALPEDDGRLLLDGVTLARRYGRDVKKGPGACWVSGPFCLPLGLACQLDFLIALMRCVFLACVRVWRRLAWVCRHTFYVMVYLCVFRYRL